MGGGGGGEGGGGGGGYRVPSLAVTTLRMSQNPIRN